eukprot:NODE_969_length_1196_cov_72.392328_g731_i0.p1 GENE.NODE_969_length_1196_cov_72.392328_g731_i0~~NODE_969_length_1196_cov_72.392328_g731_i0.p1  ORF type:complete len:284 (+),score=49.47 NODE_969_length_1196_cov_72.392328_g731_i0:115-966(+)
MFPTGRQLGGAPGNFAFHANQLGMRGVPVSCVGADDLGKEALEILQNNGLSTEGVCRTDAYPTGTVGVSLDGKGKPVYTIHENVAWDHLPFSPELQRLAGEAAALCFGTLCQRNPESRATVHRFLAATRASCIKIFDINIRQHYWSEEVIDLSLKACTVLKVSDEELPLLAKIYGLSGDDNAQMSEICKQFDISMVVLTCGPKGSTLFTPARVSQCPSTPDKPVNTVGCGDSFTATLAVGLARLKDLDWVNWHANQVAGFVCTQLSATPTLPSHILNPPSARL